MGNPMLAAALEYREAGFHVIPLLPFSKRPAINAWQRYQNVMPTVEELETWWDNGVNGIALLLGRGVFAVDVDGPEGEQALASAGIDLTGAPRSITSRGYHVFFAGDGGGANRVGLLPHVDIRTKGGYVVAPPSTHESGHTYLWTVPITGPLPAPPVALEALLRRAPETPKVQGERVSDKLTTLLAGVVEGGRDITCTRLAGYLLGKGIPQDAVEIILQRWALDCDPPLEPASVTKCVVSIAKKEGEPDGPPDNLAEIVEQAMAEIFAPPERRVKPGATALKGLDDLLGGGLYPGDYVIMGARPSIGKTAAALQFARVRAKAGDGVLVCSLEMTAIALARRLLSQESQVDAEAIKTGKIDAIQEALLQVGAGRLKKLPMWITTDVETPEQLEAALEAFEPGQLSMIVVDYLQLMRTADFARDSRQRVEQISKALKRIAIRYNVAVVVLSSLSRPPKASPNWEPELDSLRESGELEHDADIVWLLHRQDGHDETKWKQAKHRDGRTGVLDLTFHPNILTFTEGK